MSTPTVFNYFPTRDALVAAVLERIEASVGEMFARLPEAPATRRERILQLAATFRQMVQERPAETKTFLKWGVSFDPDLRPAYLAFQTRILDQLLEVMPDNSDDAATARAEARILFGASNLFSAMAFDNFQPDVIMDFVGRIADLLSSPE